MTSASFLGIHAAKAWSASYLRIWAERDERHGNDPSEPTGAGASLGGRITGLADRGEVAVILRLRAAAATRQPRDRPAGWRPPAVQGQRARPARRPVPEERARRPALSDRGRRRLCGRLHRRRLGHARPRDPAGACSAERGGLGRQLFRRPVAPLAAPPAAHAAAQHPPRQPAQHPRPLRPRQRLLSRPGSTRP